MSRQFRNRLMRCYISGQLSLSGSGLRHGLTFAAGSEWMEFLVTHGVLVGDDGSDRWLVAEWTRALVATRTCPDLWLAFRTQRRLTGKYVPKENLS